MNQEQKEKALANIQVMKDAFARLHLNLPMELSIVGGTAFNLESELLRLEAEIKSQPVDTWVNPMTKWNQIESFVKSDKFTDEILSKLGGAEPDSE